jgi:hypothetical protein
MTTPAESLMSRRGCGVLRCGLGVLALLFSLGCGGADPTNSGDETSSAAETASAAPGYLPSSFMLQFAGAYHGSGGAQSSFDSLELRRDGTFAAVVDGTPKTGRYQEHRASSTTLKINFVLDGESFTGTVDDAWHEVQHVEITRGTTTETLTSSWKAGTEELCDTSGGDWRDDDPDPRTGLYCVCPAAKVYIPSEGGCTDE